MRARGGGGGACGFLAGECSEIALQKCNGAVNGGARGGVSWWRWHEQQRPSLPDAMRRRSKGAGTMDAVYRRGDPVCVDIANALFMPQGTRSASPPTHAIG